ncbi:alpha/beta hydrolase-fold protein [Filimonas effusa]|nr:alpha/beta hydrolase-fold protein [Filimonas effusa]
MRIKDVVVLIVVLFLACKGVAQVETAILLPEKKDSIASRYLDRKQEILIHLPGSYAKSGLNYPVIVYLDGQDQGLKNLLISNLDRLMYGREIPEAIVIGIPHHHGRGDLSIESASEDTTPFMKFVTTELISFLDQNYRTLDFRTFIGHSLGGQFLAYSMTRYPDVFNAVIAISPALNYPDTESWYKRKTLTALEHFAQGKRHNHLYFCVGDAGFQDAGFKTGAEELAAILTNANNSGLYWKFDVLPGFTHGSSPAAGIPMGLIQVFKYWPFLETRSYEILVKNQGSPLKEVLEQEARIKDIYGVDIPLPRSVYWQFGKYELGKGNYDNAVKFFEKNMALDKNGSTPRSLMGDALAKMGKKEAAKKYYQEAINLLKEGESRKELEEKIKQLDGN